MVKGRFNALMAKIEHQEELTRTELRDKQIENTKSAREGFADRLDKARAGRGDALAKWLLAERLYLDVQMGANWIAWPTIAGNCSARRRRPPPRACRKCHRRDARARR